MKYNVEGSWPALVTPFNEDDKVNYDMLRKLVGFHAENHSTGVLLMGSTGEAILLNQDERKKIIDTVIDEANGKIPVMIGVAAMTTKQTIENAKYAKEAGATAGLIVQPPYIKPSQNALYHYFKDIGDAVDMPFVIYNNPERCGVNVEPETIAKLAQHKNFVAIKEAGPNPYGVMRTVELTRGKFNVLCCDCAFYALIPVVMSSGGKGTSNVTGSLCPREIAVISKPWEGYDDVLSMREMLYKYLPLIRMMYSESNPVPLKWALNHVGADVGKPRKPLQELSEANQRTMHQVMDRLGILAEDSYQREYFGKK
ncbi:MAG: 4-hydroxy-tetrahydrodipicolinate synthase [Candidatus Bathyarchaeota archaeon]|nr:4-hydroxy-tetrahydrodipicolinate synthase [Candidatus Bathyarchaeota archaeon]